AFSPDGKAKALIRNGQVHLSDGRGNEVRFEQDGFREVHAVFAFSPSGKTLACEMIVGQTLGERKPAFVLLDVATKDNRTTLTPRAVLEKAPENLKAVAFSPDGRTMASAGGNKAKQGEIRLWDARTGWELASLPDDAEVVGVAFSPDGKLLASVN